MWKREWNLHGQIGARPLWEDLTAHYKLFIQLNHYCTATVAERFWNTRDAWTKREYFDPLPTRPQIKGMQCGNPYAILHACR